MQSVQALVAGNMAPAEVPDQVSRPGHAHLRHLLTQLAQEKDHCQARLDQLQVRLCSQITFRLHSKTSLLDSTFYVCIIVPACPWMLQNVM